jgi:hypothetical protein
VSLEDLERQLVPDTEGVRSAPVAGKEPATKQEWAAWVAERVNETDIAYLAKPDFMVGHYRGEKSTASDYADRELLELVQNAADAATEAGQPGRVRIEVTEHGLCVANTGRPFRAGGVESLMTAHTSDKPDQRAPLIGAKGLGFRSLLNWSAEPYVSSGELEIGFSRRAAEQHARGLASANLQLRSKVFQKGEPRVPVLAFPVMGSALTEMAESRMIALMDRAAELRAQGYDTVVVAAFSDEDVRDRAQAQLKEFRPHFLLFVPAISELSLHCDGYDASWSKKLADDDGLNLEILTNGQSTTETWICRRQTGTMQVDGTDGEEVQSYEVAVAFRRDQENSSGTLHCYFPTEVSLPFPALFHATLDLDSHRKTIRSSSRPNRAVLKHLAQLYVQSLVTLTKSKLVRDPIWYLTRTSQFPQHLRDFEEFVYQIASAEPLVMNSNGRRVNASAVQLGPHRYDEYLPRRLFKSLAKCRSDQERGTLIRLGVREADMVHVLEHLRDANLSVAERAAVVVGFARYVPKEFHDRSLLIDPAGRPLAKSNSCFPPPSNAKPPTLPRWAKAKILHPQLWSAVAAGLGGQPQDRFGQLERFGISAFSSEGVITSLRGQAQRTLKNGADTRKINSELLLTLFQLRQTISKGANYPVGRTDVLCMDGKWRDAQSVHLSSAYGTQGNIVEALYQSRPDRLLAAPETMGLDADTGELQDFFRWIGVHSWPAVEERQLPFSLRKQVEQHLPEDFEVAEGSQRVGLRKSDMRWGSTLKAEHSWIFELDEILSGAPYAAILAWLALDQRFDPHGGFLFPTRVSARSSTRANFRSYSGQMIDLVREAVLEKPWLEVVSGAKVAPRDAMMAPGGLGKLFHVPRYPTVEETSRFGLDRLLWRRGLQNAGVPSELSDLSEIEIYRLLGDLKGREAPPDLVRRLYLQVLDLDTFNPADAGEVGENFRELGSVQVRMNGNLSWVLAGDALYLDRDNFPTAARDFFALIDLPPRRSATEVAARFGVPAVSKQAFSMTVSKVVVEETVLAALLRTRLSDCLPFIKAYRSAQSVETQKLRQLEKLRLQVASEVQIEVSLGSQMFPGVLEPGQYVLNGEDLIVAVDATRPEEEVMLTAITAMSDGLAEFFELQSGDDFEKILAGETKNLRLLQLRRLLSNQPGDEVEKLLASIGDLDSSSDIEGNLDAVTFEKGTGPSMPSSPVPPKSNEPKQLSAHDPSERPAPSLDLAGGIEATELEVPEQRSTRRKVNVRIAGDADDAQGGDQQSSRDRSAPTDAEHWAMLFEDSEGRFPIRVSRLQGMNAFGCDCLSFATKANRDAFKDDPKQLKLVERFIEVKSGSVRLTENEMIAAEKHKKRFFVYRIQFDALSRAAAHLTIVSHPLSHRSALARECEIVMEKVKGRQRYRLSPRNVVELDK